jgi:uncharacterized iron-regulated membrane protein
MATQKNWRTWHRWISIVIALPFLVTISTGILLSTRGFNTWVQPSYAPAKKRTLQVSFDQLLKTAQEIPQAGIHSWSDVSQIDIRPTTAQVRLRSKASNWEIEIDGETGQVLGVAERRVSWLTALHEGSYFGNIVRYGVFFPSAIGVLFLLISGVIIFFKAIRPRRSV